MSITLTYRRSRPSREETDHAAREKERTMLTIDDIAKRWSVSVRQARAVVVASGIPRIELRPAPGRYISWRTTRFALADVEAWEESRKTAGRVPDPPPSVVKVKPRGSRPSVRNHLGHW